MVFTLRPLGDRQPYSVGGTQRSSTTSKTATQLSFLQGVPRFPRIPGSSRRDLRLFTTFNSRRGSPPSADRVMLVVKVVSRKFQPWWCRVEDLSKTDDCQIQPTAVELDRGSEALVVTEPEPQSPFLSHRGACTFPLARQARQPAQHQFREATARPSNSLLTGLGAAAFSLLIDSTFILYSRAL